jgi:murein DD-endopeptidase MepM/ murein hydrolase activator NlpD
MMPFAKAGLYIDKGPLTPEDLEVLHQAGIEAVKLPAQADPILLDACRDAGIHTFLVQLLSQQPGVEPTPPEAFVDEMAPRVEAFLKKGVIRFEVHGEPNLPRRGYGVSWAEPAAFSDWFLQVADRLRTTFGPPLEVGFPGLAWSEPRPPGDPPAVSDDLFLETCGLALEGADFVCCHVYWTSQEEMRDYHGALRFLRTYLERTDRPVVISAFANVDPAQSPAEKGDQYAEFYFFCSQYDRLEEVYAYLLRSSDPTFAGMAWVGTEIPARVGSRRRMPHPSTMRLTWPTAARAYTQAYGERQRRYFEASFDPVHNVHWLHGGHEGVDLQAAEGTPVRACLAGRVSIGPPGTAYGNYVRVVSRLPTVGEVTLLYAHLQQILAEDGVDVTQGEVLGLAGQSGNTTGPHLHLGLRIRGLSLRATSHYLNARPYLDPVRGSPRVQYARTYVLLPPGADQAWARAVVEATWDAHRFTVGGSADDAGIGDLDVRRVIAVNPAAWDGDLQAFFKTYYPGIIYVPVEVTTPDELTDRLAWF